MIKAYKFRYFPFPLRLVTIQCAFIGLLFCCNTLHAHEIRPAYLEIKQLDTEHYQILWKIPILQNRAPKIDPQFPEGFSLKQESEALLPDAYIRRYSGSFSAPLNGKAIRIEGLDMTLIDVLVQINLLHDLSYTLMLQPDQPGATIPIEPSRWEVAKLYLKLGIEHILIGLDHLLFVLGLLLLVSSIPTLIKTITAFTLAHSITLGLASLELIQLPSAPVEAIIALSIVFLAKEYISFRNGQASLTAQYPWIVAFIFGLLHGFGFAGALSEIGFPQKEIPMALFTFNVGVELGQLFFIGILLLLRFALSKIQIKKPNWSWKIIPYAMGSVAMFWLIERVLGF